jgi:dUTP pyrophosphatase
MRTRGLLVAEGILDQGYTGLLYIGAWNLTQWPVRIRAGDRVAQLVLHSVVADRVDVAEIGAADLPETARGRNGFGSTGG